MSKALEQNKTNGAGKTLAHGWVPISVSFSPGQCTRIVFSNGKQADASCLRCHQAPCMRFRDDEITLSSFPDFPADRLNDVCPTRAISRPDGIGVPKIDSNLCIFCGVCATRCPVGAIRLDPRQGAIIEDTPNEAFLETLGNSEKQLCRNLRLFEAAPQDGNILLESEHVVDTAFSRLSNGTRLIGDQFPNILVRNLLIGVGIGAATRRKGNNYMRMDLILGPPGIERGVAEVEFGDLAILEAPRDILDSVAVLVSRYQWPKKSIIPLVIVDVLPNWRSEYWSVIQDIRDVLSLHVGTLTVFTLMLLNWNRIRVDLTRGHPFYVDRDTHSYREEVLEVLLKRPLKIRSTPRPYIDVAK